MKNHNFRLTTAQLAQICGVSQGTVDRALNGRAEIRPETRARILRVAAEYGYRPEPTGTRMIGVLVFDLENAYFSGLITELERCAQTTDASVIVMLSHKDPVRERQCLERLYRTGADGIVLCPIRTGAEYTAYLRSFHVPVVTVGNRLDGIPHVGIDDFAAMTDVTRYVCGHGYDRLIYVSPKLPTDPSINADAPTARYRAFCAAARRPYTVVDSPEAVPDALEPGVRNAVICATDDYALSLWQLSRARGFGLTGFDGLTLLDQMRIPLDTVVADRAVAAQGVLNALTQPNPRGVTVPHRLIVRGSVESPLENTRGCAPVDG